ncbi:peptidase S24-like protein [Chitinophaga polysaccharea]|uniref:Peptidase S24-like protein n=1 Tax=Chitinophaga polysaccharea TaxID=1293035 RepID=A0A561PGT5_9BACT|nr:S24 family peptidase [Chitinophaga polysaccharea]TWF37322.1 peptidase S24-like protein [Chitinophaga polysaccharea]
MTQLNRLKEAVAILKKTRRDLTNQLISRELSYNSRNYMSDILGGSKGITKLFLERLEVVYSISGKWITTGKGKMFIDVETNNNIVTEQPIPYRRKRRQAEWIGVPIFDVPITLSVINHESTPVGYVTIPLFKDCAFGIRISGDDMRPKICNGDYILCKEVNINEIIMGDDYLVLTHNGNEIVRYVYPHEKQDDCISLNTGNQSKPSTTLAISAIRKMYKVKGVIKSY